MLDLVNTKVMGSAQPKRSIGERLPQSKLVGICSGKKKKRDAGWSR